MNNRVNDAKRRIEIIEDGIRKSANKRNISKEDIYKRKLSKQNAERELKAKEEKRKSILMTYYKLKKGFQKLNYLMNKNFKFKLDTCAFVNFAVIENTFLYAVVSNFISLLNASLAVRYPNILRGRLFIHCWIFLIV